MPIQGLILSFITVAIWALERVSSRWLLVSHHVHPVIFTCFSLFVCSIVLILIAGPGKGGLQTLRQPHTWAYGFLQVLMNITDMLMLALITSTQASFLARLSIIMAIFLKWMFFPAFKPNRLDWYGMPLILGGIAVVAMNLDPSIRVLALFWLFLTVLFNTMRTLIAEIHPAAATATTIKQRCRVTGYVVLTTSFVLILFLFAIAGIKSEVPPAEIAFLSQMPSFSDLMEWSTLSAATLMGVTLLPIAMYFYFYSARVAKTEIFMMVTSIQPFLAFALESTFQYFGLVSIRQISPSDLAAGGIIVLGAMMMIYGRYFNMLDYNGAGKSLLLKLVQRK